MVVLDIFDILLVAYAVTTTAGLGSISTKTRNKYTPLLFAKLIGPLRYDAIRAERPDHFRLREDCFHLVVGDTAALKLCTRVRPNFRL
jgi:hypothetical protein